MRKLLYKCSVRDKISTPIKSPVLYVPREESRMFGLPPYLFANCLLNVSHYSQLSSNRVTINRKFCNHSCNVYIKGLTVKKVKSCQRSIISKIDKE